jgi:hypothetical protein
LKVNGQLRVKLYKSEIKDQIEKKHKYRADVEVRMGVKLYKIERLKPIRGKFERNHKSKD